MPFRSHRLEAHIDEGGLGEMNGCKVTVLAKVGSLQQAACARLLSSPYTLPSGCLSIIGQFLKCLYCKTLNGLKRSWTSCMVAPLHACPDASAGPGSRHAHSRDLHHHHMPRHACCCIPQAADLVAFMAFSCPRMEALRAWRCWTPSCWQPPRPSAAGALRSPPCGRGGLCQLPIPPLAGVCPKPLCVA